MIHLSPRLRWSSAIIGTLMGLFAGVAVWRGTDGAASTAFVAGCALFLILAMSGVIPSRIKSGEHELELLEDRIDPIIDAAAEGMNQSELQSFTEALEEKEARDPTPLNRLARKSSQQALADEAYLAQITFAAADEAGVKYATSKDDRNIDAWITNGRKSLPVLLMARAGPTGVIRRVRGLSENDSQHVLFVVTDLDRSLFADIDPVDPFTYQGPKVTISEASVATMTNFFLALFAPSEQRSDIKFSRMLTFARESLLPNA